MCETCGCSDDQHVRITKVTRGQTDHEAPPHDHDHSHAHGHSHGHSHSHEHPHAHGHSHGTTVSVEVDLLAKNNLLAQRNRGWFEGRGILALNLVSSPGAGKTTLLVRTLEALGKELTFGVIEGDQETSEDARRIAETGCGVVQVNTGTGCHLDAHMVAHALETLRPPTDSVVMIENVGNLVCPALFDLGELCKVCIISVTEGEDKPLKYPYMFRASQVLILNKTDLLPHVDFDVERCLGYARQVNPDLLVFQLSASTGEGMEEWLAWLQAQIPANPSPPA